jgi:hypothetical protein
MRVYSKVPKLVNAINKGDTKAVSGKKGLLKPEVKKKYPKTPKPIGTKGRGTKSTSVKEPKSAVKVKRQGYRGNLQTNEDLRRLKQGKK